MRKEYKNEYRNEDGYLHRVNGPAIIWCDGDYTWCYNGQYHRYYGVARHWAGENKYLIFNKRVR